MTQEEYRKQLGLPPVPTTVPFGLVPPAVPEPKFIPPMPQATDPWREKLGLPTSPMYKRTLPELPPLTMDPSDMAERELLDMLSASEDPMEIINTVNSAEYLASSLKIPREIAYGNLDTLSQWWSGKLLPKPTLLQNIRSAADNGLRIYNKGHLGYELMNLETMGGDPEAIAALVLKIDELDKQMENLPYTPKQWMRYALTMASQSVPMMVKGLTKGYAMGTATGATAALMMTGMAGAMALGPITGGISIPAMALLMASVGQVVGMTEDLSLNSAGLQYLENRAKGVPAGINGPLSVLSGFIQGALESAGEIAVLGVLKVPGLKTLGKMVSDKVFATGMAGRVATALAARMTSTGLGEGTEEVLQELASVLTEQVARDWSKAVGVETKIPPADMAAFLERFKQSFIGGASAGLIFGVAGMPGAVRGDVRQFSTIRDLARVTPDKAAFIEGVKKYGLAEGKAGEAAWETYLGKVWDKQQKEVKQKLVAKAPTGAPSPAITPPAAAAVQRAPTGALQTAVQNQVTSKGGLEADFVAGAEGQRYGYLHYETVGDLVTITEAVNETEVTDVRKELILSLAAANPGKTIEWQVANEEEADLLDEIVTTNPRGVEFGIQRYEGPVTVTPATELTQERFVSEMSTLFNVKEKEQSDLIAGLVSKFASHLGLEGDAFVQRYFSPELIRQGPQAQAMLQAGKGAAGTMFEVEGKSIGWEEAQKIAKDNVGMVKAAFTALQTGDFHHAIHELIHPIMVLALTPEDIALLETATGIPQAKWTENTHEWIATNWENYLGTGKAPTPEMATFFEKLSKLLREIVSYMRERGLALGVPLEEVLSPEFTAAFDNLLQDPRSGLRQAAAEDIAPNTPENAKTDNVERALQQELAVQVLEPAPEPVPEDALPDIIVDPMQTPVVNIALNRIVLSDEVPNFKRAANAKGIITELKSKEYIRVPANPVTLWQRIMPKGPGELEIITGRHRVDLARRLGETAIPAQILREADGFTAAMAMTFDAEANIRGGKGDIEDYAIYFQKSDISIEDAEARGLLDTDKGRKGFAIGRYATNGLFSSWANGLISTEKAAAIASAARGDEQLTASALSQWVKDKSISAETLSTFIDIQRSQRSVSQGEHEGVQGGFPWDSESNTKDSISMAEQKAKIVRELRVEQNVLKNATQLGKAEKAAILAPYGIEVGDTAALKTRIAGIEEEINRWGFWMTDAGLQTQLRERAGLKADALYHRDPVPFHRVMELPSKPIDPSVKQVSGDNAENLYAMVEAVRDELKSWGEQYKGKGEVFRRPKLKNYERVVQKAQEIALDEMVPVSYDKIMDIDAATIVVDTLEEVADVTAAILADPSVVRLKNYYAKTHTSGFRAILMNVRMSNGVISEMQVMDRQTWNVKNGIGHTMYQIDRELTFKWKSGELARDLYVKVIEPLNELSQEIYDSIYQAVLTAAISKASSLDIRGRLKSISELSKEIGVDSMLEGNTLKQLRDFVSTAIGQAFQSTKTQLSSIPLTSTTNVQDTAENSKPWFAPLLHPGENYELVAEQFIRKPVRVQQAKQALFGFADKTDAWMKDDAAQIKLFEEAKAEAEIATVSPTLTVPKAGMLFHETYGENAKDLTDKAVRFYGITTNPKEAGFLLPDGRMLDLSGAIKGERHIDHRSCNGLMPAFVEHPESEVGLALFLSLTEAARMHDGPTFGFFHLNQQPTGEQMKGIMQILSGKREAILAVGKAFGRGVLEDSSVMDYPTAEKIEDYYKAQFDPQPVEGLFHPAEMRDGKPTQKTIEWFGDSVVRTDEGTPQTVFHGTLSEMAKFDIEKARGGYFGKAFYFTDSAVDASENYAQRSGGDVAYNIEKEAERLDESDDVDELIDQWVARHPEDAETTTLLENPVMDYTPVQKTRPTTTRRATTTQKKPATRERVFIKETTELNTIRSRDQRFAILMKIAAERLGLTHGGAIFPVYLKMKNPVYFNTKNATVFNVDPEQKDTSFLDALSEVVEQYGATIPDAIWDYGEEATGESLLKLMEAPWLSQLSGEPVTAGALLAETWESMGYDGIVQNARNSFPTMQGVKGATHYIAFRPEQAKTIWNPAPTDSHAELLMHPDTMKDVEPWFHQSLKVVNEKIKGPMSASQIKKTLLANGVKLDEMKWDGWDELLVGEKMLSPEDLRNYMAANAVQVIEQEITPVQFDRWKTAGGTNYHEVALALPYEEIVTDESALPREVIPGKEAELADVQKRMDVFYAKRTAVVTKTAGTPEQYGQFASLEAMEAEEDALHIERDTYTRPIHPPIPPAYKRIGPYTEGHYKIKNIVAHVRYQTFIEPMGAMAKYTCFIEEIQSDWHQKGRKGGYEGQETPAFSKKTQALIDEVRAVGVTNPVSEISMRDIQDAGGSRELATRWFRAMQTEDFAAALGAVPFAPFSKTWPELAMKRMIAHAVQQGFDVLAWTTGDQQNERYSLAKEVDTLEVTLQSDGAWWILGKKGGRQVINTDDVGEDRLDAYIGEELADKARADIAAQEWVQEPGETAAQRYKMVTYTGEALKLGGKGMRGFYDKMLVDYANKYAKKWGSRVEDVEIDEKRPASFQLINPDGSIISEGTEAAKLRWEKELREGQRIVLVAEEKVIVHGLPITEAMKQSVPEGQPLYHPVIHPDFELGEDRGAYADLMVEARKYDTVEEFVDEQERLFGEETPGNVESYRAIWEEAHKAPPPVVPPAGIPAVVREEKEYDYAEKVELAKEVDDKLLAAKITMGEVTQAELEGITAPAGDEALKAKMVEAQRQVDEVMDQFTPEEQYVITLADELSTILSFEAKAKKSQARITSLQGRLKTALAKNAKLINVIWELGQNAKLDKAFAQTLADARAAQEVDKRAQLKVRLYAERRAAMAKFRQQSQEARQKQRAATKLKVLITKLVAQIMKPAGKGVEFLRYAEEIARIQSTIDPKRHWASTLAEREASRTFSFGKHPELAALVPPATLQRIYSVPVQNLTLSQIEEVYEIVKVLRDQGRLFRSLDLKQAQRGRAQTTGQLAAATLQGEAQEEVIGAPKKTPALAKGWIWSLKPDRIAKWLDGVFHGVKEHGPWFKILQTLPNQTDDSMQKAIRERSTAVAERMKELKLTTDPLGIGKASLVAGMDIDGFRMSDGKMPGVDQVMYWYLGMKNQRTAEAILYGVKIPENVVLKGIAQLTPAQIEIADMIGKDFSDNFPRVREAFIDAFNMELAREDHYVPMNRLETSYKSRKEAVGMELAGRQGLAKQFMDRGFTHERIDISPEHQKPINTHLLAVWQAGVRAQEGFIHQDRMIKDMHSIIESDTVKAAVQQKYGSEMNEWLSKYINALAGEDEYRHQNGLEKFSRIMRSNAAIAWLGFNMLSAAKQLTGVVGYMADAGPLHLMSAAAQYLAGAGKSIGKGKLLNNTLIDEVYAKSERLRNRKPAQELEDLRRLDNTVYQSLLKKIGMAGMLGLQTIDTATVVIGWKAVYDKTLAKTGDEQVARTAADEATTRSQPSSRVQDMAQMYRSGEVMKWFTMFTSELSQTWNRLSFDVPAALRNGQYTRALADLISFSIVGMGIALASGALHGDDDEKKRKKLLLGTFSQFIEAIPFIGSDLYSTVNGRPFVGGGVRFFPAMANIQKLVPQIQKAGETGEWEATILGLAEAIALVGGIPFVGPRRAYQAAQRGDLEALLGWPKEEE